MKRIGVFSVATMVAGFLCLGVLTGTDASAAAKNACSEDIAKFCKNIEPGWMNLMDCLEKHESELSAACREYEAKMGGPRVEREERAREKRMFRQVCKADVDKYCKDAVPRQGGIVKCLNEHTSELSEACGWWIKATAGKFK